MRKALGALYVVIALTSMSVYADDVAGPILKSGFDAYKTDGAQAAIKAWLKGSPLENSKEALSQANMLNQIQDFYGPFKSYDVIQNHTIAPSSHIVYLAINFEHGALFGKFLVFTTKDGSTISSFRFHTDADQVLPGSLIVH